MMTAVYIAAAWVGLDVLLFAVWMAACTRTCRRRPADWRRGLERRHAMPWTQTAEGREWLYEHCDDR